jgi:hypothetical protein
MVRSIFSGSILKKTLLLTWMLALGIGPTAVLAQRTTVHSPGGGPIGPPISHPPISRSPGLAAPPALPGPPTLAAPPVRAVGTYTFHSPPRPILPRPPVLPIFGFPFFPGATTWWAFGPPWGFNSFWRTTCHQYLWPFGYNALSFYQFVPGTAYVAPPSYPVYPAYFYGEEGQDLPQLFLKDGTVYEVTDYWVVNGQLHFKMHEEDGTKPAEHVIGFDELDLQQTIDVNTARGFRFVLRNQPIEKYLGNNSKPSSSSPVQQ